MGSRTSVVAALVLVACAGCNQKPVVVVEESPDVGPPCAPGFQMRFAHCFCTNNTACPEGQICEAVTGACVPKPPPPPVDAGVFTCTIGARRCTPLGAGIQECADGAWTEVERCGGDAGTGICFAGATGFYCTICLPGERRCAGSTAVETCSDHGDAWVSQACPVLASGVAVCVAQAGACQVCNPGEKRCSADHSSLEICDADGLSWRVAYCDYTGKCDPATTTCVAPLCIPGTSRCKDAVDVEFCNSSGSGYSAVDCRTLSAESTEHATCRNNACFDPCATAAKYASYEGCDYWAVALSNSMLDKAFKGNAADGTQPSATSEFALVVSNAGTDVANIKVTRKVGGAEQVSPMSPAPNAQGVYPLAGGGLQTLKLPWQSVKRTGLAPYAYHLVSDVPISVYQFNPVTSEVGSWSTTYSYTNDASLLLPTHILTRNYVVVGQDHMTNEDMSGNVSSLNALLAVVGTEDNTTLTVRFSAATEPSPSGGNGTIAAQTIGTSQTYTLNRYDVLQILSDWDEFGAHPVACSSPSQYQNPALSEQLKNFCRYKSDPTGTIVASDKPVAVFGGADCTLKPYDRMACDHIEEEMLPFETWGKHYVGVRSHAYKDSYDDDVSSRSPDFWRVVSACGKADCPAGALVNINPGPHAVLEPGKTLYCTGHGGDCVLPPVDPASGVFSAPFVEFEHEGDFLVSADQPIILAQYLTSEDANKPANFDPATPEASGYSVEGDPSLILAAPLEQWRTSYHVLASPTMSHNYLNLAVKSAAPSITIDGKALSTFSGRQQGAVPGGFTVYRVPVGKGAHTISSGVIGSQADGTGWAPSVH